MPTRPNARKQDRSAEIRLISYNGKTREAKRPTVTSKTARRGALSGTVDAAFLTVAATVFSLAFILRNVRRLTFFEPETTAAATAARP